MVTGDHYGHNCPKAKKKGEETRAMTPYPRRYRTSSGDRSNASQGNDTFRIFHAYFGTVPWKVLVEETAHSTPATATEGSAPAAPAAPAQQDADTAPTADPVREGRGAGSAWSVRKPCQGSITRTSHRLNNQPIQI